LLYWYKSANADAMLTQRLRRFVWSCSRRMSTRSSSSRSTPFWCCCRKARRLKYCTRDLRVCLHWRSSPLVCLSLDRDPPQPRSMNYSHSVQALFIVFSSSLLPPNKAFFELNHITKVVDTRIFLSLSDCKGLGKHARVIVGPPYPLRVWGVRVCVYSLATHIHTYIHAYRSGWVCQILWEWECIFTCTHKLMVSVSSRAVILTLLSFWTRDSPAWPFGQKG
jgi:hypothetical protein